MQVRSSTEYSPSAAGDSPHGQISEAVNRRPGRYFSFPLLHVERLV